jgi:hypothetical protein
MPNGTASANTTAPSVTMASPSHPNNVDFPKKVYWPLVAACGTAAVFDAQMSHGYLTRHPDQIESGSWLLGRRPSLGRYYATFAIMDGGVAVISYKLLHSRHKPLRVIGWGLLGGQTAIHTDDDIVMATE